MVYRIILGNTAHIFYFSSPLLTIMATQRARYEHCFCALNWSCIFLFLFCVVLSIFFNWLFIFTSSEHRNGSMVWNLRQTFFCFDGHMSINIYRWFIYLWLFLPILRSNWSTRNRNRGSEVCWKGLAAHSAEVWAWCSRWKDRYSSQGYGHSL